MQMFYIQDVFGEIQVLGESEKSDDNLLVFAHYWW